MKKKKRLGRTLHALSESHKLMRHTSNDMMDSLAIMSTSRTTIEAAKSINENVFHKRFVHVYSTSDANVGRL